MVLVFHHVIIFFLLSDWLIQILPPFWFCCDVACFCFGSETQLKCTYRRCCQFFKNIVLCLDVLSGRESASMATFFFMTLLLISRMLPRASFQMVRGAPNCQIREYYPNQKSEFWSCRLEKEPFPFVMIDRREDSKINGVKRLYKSDALWTLW